MDITVFTNHVIHGWHPDNLSTFLGGNEESMTLWSRAMSKFANVTVYTSLPVQLQNGFKDDDVQYLDRSQFDFNAKYEVLISFKVSCLRSKILFLIVQSFKINE